MSKPIHTFKYPGVRTAVDGNTAVSMCERESTDAAGAYPITPSTQMGEYWAEATAQGHINVSGRPLIFVEPEGEHAAAAVTAGLSMTGLRASNFSSGQGIAYMHESLYAAVGKRLPYVLNVGARAMTKATLNVHAGHDDYHCIDDTGFFQMFAKDAQSAADLNIIAHRVAELALTPGAIAQDGFLTTHLIESIQVPERELIKEYLGSPDDIIDTPTPAQQIIYGPQRRRIPELWSVDNPMMAGTVQNQDAYMQSVAAQRPYFFDHIAELTDRSFDQFQQLTGRSYQRVMTYRAADADYLIVGQGSMVSTAEAVADYLRDSRGIAVGVVNLLMFRPFPADLLSRVLKGKRGVAVLERLDQPLAVDLPMMREIRATISRALENGRDRQRQPYPDLDTYRTIADAPPLFSGSFGMGSRDLQPEGIIAAIENMLPDGAQQRFFYLSIDFLRDEPISPKQRVHQEAIADSYPQVRKLAIHGSENPNLMPRSSITVRMHSIGGWGAITTGKNLAMTLYDLLDFHIKANPKYGSEKKGQPTTYYLSAAPEPIRVNSEYFYVDVVLSPDPNVFHHTNALAGLKEGGVFIIQSDKNSPEEVWTSIPEPYRRIIVDKRIQLFYLDAFKIAREEASDPDLQLRMQGIAFQGAFFSASPVAERASLSQQRLLDAIHAQLQHKFGSKGARVVRENLAVVKRGFDEVHQVPHGPVESTVAVDQSRPIHSDLPVLLKTAPQSHAAGSDIHRFWSQTGSLYAQGKGTDSIADPFMSLGTMPAVTTLFRDMSGIRFEHPQWIAENCTACGSCFTVCPDTAIPGLVSEISQIFDTVVARVRKNHPDLQHLPGAVRQLERQLRDILVEASEQDNVRGMLTEAIGKTLRESKLPAESREGLKQELKWFEAELGDFQFALSRPYFTLHENQSVGDGGLLSITVNPNTCKGCMECVEVCNDDALRPIKQTEDSLEQLRRNWDLWQDLPTTPSKYIRISDLENGIGALETLLLDKNHYSALASGDGACLGCGEKTVVHLFTATVEALMQPRVEKQVAKLDGLIKQLQSHIQQRIVQEIDVSDSSAIAEIIDEIGQADVTLAAIAQRVEQNHGGEPIDQTWLRRVTKLLASLQQLKWKYTAGVTGRGRAAAGILNATGCSSVWGSTFPYNPYPFPWANHLFQDAASVAMGVFEGHMAKMADGFRAVRLAERELSGGDMTSAETELRRFNWRQFSDEEWELCPPVVAVGGDGAMYDIGFQNLSRAMMSGMPIKVLVLDTQVYSNTGGQACTSGFFGQISDMAQFGEAMQGKREIRKEIGLVGMAHRTTYILQSSVAQPSHLIEGFIQGLKTRRPALFSIYTSCQPEHGIGDNMSTHQAKLAVESRAYPLFRYNPDLGNRPEACFDLEGNPAIDQDWPTYELNYQENGRQKSMTLPMTFADFAATEIRFRKHFRVAPPETWNEQMIPLDAYLELTMDQREDHVPYIWSVNRQQELMRLLVADPIVHSCEDRRDFWTMLRSLARADEQAVDPEELKAELRGEMSQQIAASIMRLVTGESIDSELLPLSSESVASAEDAAGNATADRDSKAKYMAPWIDTPKCTSCDECIKLNGKIFAYNDQKKAVIVDPSAGPYKDLVKAAERCTAQIIHPGLPKDRREKDIDQWIARGKVQLMNPSAMQLFGTKTFAHGIHPPAAKDETHHLPIHQFSFAPLLIIPLSQHIGKPAIPIVEEGDEVARGQRIADPDGFLSVAIHAPASGTIRRLAPTPTITGKMQLAFFLEPFPASTQEVAESKPLDPDTARPEEIIRAIQFAGVVGLGGAGFPTHAKLKATGDKAIDTLVINGVECEPYLTTDHRVMLEHPKDVMTGIRYLLRAIGADRAIIAVEANKQDAADALRNVIPSGAPITVEVLPVKYPQGAEKMLITALLKREIPSGGLPADIGAICVNVGTAAELGKLLPHGMGLQERVITVGGPGIQHKGNFRIPIGTPLRFILETVGVADDLTTVVLGGPMMGAAAASLDIPITKGSTGVIGFTSSHASRVHDRQEYPCIRCGYCVDACPIFLNPSRLGLLADQGDHLAMAQSNHLFDCFECGCCTYVCPSHIPLVQKFRIAKAAVRKTERIAR